MTEKSEQKEARICRVMTVLTPQIVQRLDVIAEKRIVNRSILIRQACEKYLRELETEAA